MRIDVIMLSEKISTVGCRVLIYVPKSSMRLGFRQYFVGFSSKDFILVLILGEEAVIADA